MFIENPFEGVNEPAHNGELGFQTRDAACPFRRRDLLLQLPAFLLEECEIGAELGEPLVDFGFGAHAVSVACGAGKHAGGAPGRPVRQSAPPFPCQSSSRPLLLVPPPAFARGDVRAGMASPRRLQRP